MRFATLAVFLLLSGPAMAQDAPYFPRAATEDQDLGGINQNFRDLSDRGKDLVGGSDVPGNKCFGTDALCYNDALSRAEVGPNGVCFADGTCQTTAAEAYVPVSSFTAIPLTNITATALGVAQATVTFTAEAGTYVVMMNSRGLGNTAIIPFCGFMVGIGETGGTWVAPYSTSNRVAWKAVASGSTYGMFSGPSMPFALAAGETRVMITCATDTGTLTLGHPSTDTLASIFGVMRLF